VAVKPAVPTPSTAAAATPPKPVAIPKPVIPPGATAAAAVASKPASVGTWYAQCGVYSMLENAQSLRDELSKRGMSCDMTPFENAKGTSYRVRCGPFKSRGEAEIVVSRISDRVQAIVVDGSR
jgi:DedD protein